VSGRQWYNDAKHTSQGLVHVFVSFTTNGTSDPDVTLFRGCGGLKGADASGGANSGPSAVTSILRYGVGSFNMLLADSYRFVQYKAAHIDDADDDGLVARCGPPTSEGTGNGGTPITVPVVVILPDSSGEEVETTGRVISVHLVLKDSMNGS
jgi:hypothetical protein